MEKIRYNFNHYLFSAISLTPDSLCLKEKKLRFSLCRRLGVLQNRSERFGEETNLFPLPEKRKRILRFCILDTDHGVQHHPATSSLFKISSKSVQKNSNLSVWTNYMTIALRAVSFNRYKERTTTCVHVKVMTKCK